MKTELTNFGFEIEGEWSTEAFALAESEGEMHGDGSIRTCENPKHGFLPTFEMTSRVFTAAELDTKAKEFFEALHEHYAKKDFHFNASMGFHVHTSYNERQPGDIMSKEFTDFFRDRMSKQFPGMFKRRQNNQYCKAHEYTDREIVEHRGDRYRMVNYCALGRHGTIEFRIFPSAPPRTMYKYLAATVACIKEFAEQELTRTFEFDLAQAKAVKEEERNFCERLDLRRIKELQTDYFWQQFLRLQNNTFQGEALRTAAVDFANRSITFNGSMARIVDTEAPPRFHHALGQVERHSPIILPS